MKLLFGVILCLSIGLSVGFPANNPNDDAELVIVPKGHQGQENDGPDDETYFKSIGFPFHRPSFGGLNIGFGDSFDDIFKRLGLHFNAFGPTDTKEVGDDAVAFPIFGRPIPEGGNTKHTVEVIDNHRVDINDTVFEKKSDFGNSVFKIRIIKVRPLDSEERVDEGTTALGATDAPPKKPESTKESTEDVDETVNEINTNSKDPENTVTTIAPLSESTITFEVEKENTEEATTPSKTEDIASTSFASNNDDADSDNEEDNEKLFKEVPESINNYSNNIKMKKNGNIEFEFEFQNGNRYDSAALNEGILEKLEYINNNQQHHPLQDEFSADTDTKEEAEHNDDNINSDEWDSAEKQGIADNNIYANDIDWYAPESVPVDLSNDIAVNDMLADQGFVDPEAEVFDVNELVGHKPFTKLEIYEPIKRK